METPAKIWILDRDHLRELQEMFEQAQEAAREGKPGACLFQIWPDGEGLVMSGRFVPHRQASHIQSILQGKELVS